MSQSRAKEEEFTGLIYKFQIPDPWRPIPIEERGIFGPSGRLMDYHPALLTRDKVVDRTIEEVSEILGTYGMGGAGFFGLRLSTATALPPQWYYYLEDDPHRMPDGWYQYDRDLNIEVERLYLQHKQGSSDKPIVQPDGSGFCYELDLEGMVQRNTRSGKKRPICRTTNGQPPNRDVSPDGTTQWLVISIWGAFDWLELAQQGGKVRLQPESLKGRTITDYEITQDSPRIEMGDISLSIAKESGRRPVWQGTGKPRKFTKSDDLRKAVFLSRTNIIWVYV